MLVLPDIEMEESSFIRSVLRANKKNFKTQHIVLIIDKIDIRSRAVSHRLNFSATIS
jgi:hypothetical protein